MPTRSAVPVYRHHKGSGQAYIWANGRRHYLGRWDSPESKERYSRFIAELAARPADPVPIVPPSPDSITVVELLDSYWQHARTYYIKDGAPTSSLESIRRALQPLRKLYGMTAARDFGPLALKAVRQDMLAAGRRNRTTINMRIDIIRRVFRWGVAEELVPPSVAHGLQSVPGLRKGRTEAPEPEAVLPVDDDVVEATLEHLPQVVADMVRFQRLAGARPGEVCQLRPCDLDRSGEVWTYRPASHKTEHHGRERIIYIGPQAQDVLRPYLLREATAYCFSPAESERKRHVEMRARRKSRVQPSQRNRRKARPKRAPGAAYGRTGYATAIRRGVEKANRARIREAEVDGVEPVLLPRWHPNQLRHAKATEVRKRFGLEAAQVILGHAKADVTQVYAERDAALAVEVARRTG